MALKQKGILPVKYSVIGKYQVLLFIKHSRNAETYRVKGQDGKIYFLKLFDLTKLERSAFDDDNNLLEIEVLKQVKHPNIVGYKDSGELIFEGRKYVFLVLDFIFGETLSERLARKPISTFYDVKQIAIGVLNGLKYLHSFDGPVIHNEITPQNIMLDMSGNIEVPRIIDFGYARFFHQPTKAFTKEGLDLQYIASECFNNLYSPQSDLFSVGAVMYYILFGLPPWFKGISKFHAERGGHEELLLKERKKPLPLPNIENQMIDFDESVIEIIKKALSHDLEGRFQSADEFIRALNGAVPVELEEELSEKTVHGTAEETITGFVEKGRGFSAIAGMEQLKEKLRNDVINVIENPEEYKKHNLGLPNGMLLYGPPGCGKTFFAERFAEEAGYNFIKVVSSDIASIYVHGTQEKIGKIFREARAQAPTILYFDEIDAMIPARERVNNQSQSAEVNEFLSQLDNIGDSGVFVIGSTNKPGLIDKAVLRSGRLEKCFYVPPPDFEARSSMFELYLRSRPLDLGIDYHRLAELTENYVSSDIKLLVDEASRNTIREGKKRISMEVLKAVIRSQKPTVSLEELRKYEKIKRQMEGESGEDDPDHRPTIGFKI